MVDPNPATGDLGTTGVAHDSSAGNKENTGVPDDPTGVRVDPARTRVPTGLPVDPAGNMTMADMEIYLEGKEVQIATVVDDMLCMLDTCLVVEPTFGLMRISVESLNHMYLACRKVWRLIEKWQGKKEENGDFKDLIFPYKHKIGASFRVMCDKVYEKVKIFLSNAQGNVDQELFYLMMQSNSKLFFVEFSEEHPVEAENAKRMTNEAKTEAQAKVDGIPDGSCAIKTLFLLNDAFIKYELKHSIQEALSTAVKGCKMLILCSWSTEREEDYEDMIENFKKAITSWTPSMIERVGHNCEQLHPLLTNPTEMIRSVEPAAGQTTGMTAEPAARDVIAEPAVQDVIAEPTGRGVIGMIGDIESQHKKKHSTSREIGVKYVLYAILQSLAFATFYVFSHTKVFAEYAHYLPNLNLGTVAFVLGAALFFHIMIIGNYVLRRERLSQFSATTKLRNVVVSSVMVIGSVWLGCVFQRQELKEFYLMLVSLLVSIYAIILSYLVSPGVDLGVPDGFASFALHICCYFGPSWWFTGLCCYCICVQVYKYMMMG